MTRPRVRRRPVLQGSGAGAAGLLFALLFTVGFLLLDHRPAPGASDVDLVDYYRGPGGTGVLVAGAYLVPFAGICFLWFLAASRHRLSRLAQREDALLATVQLGGGLLFVALFFVAGAAAVSGVATVRLGGDVQQAASGARTMTSLGQATLMIYTFRAGAVFVLASATRALRAGLFPRWFAMVSYLAGLALLLVLSYVRVAVLVMPAWVAGAALIVLFRRTVRHFEEA